MATMDPRGPIIKVSVESKVVREVPVERVGMGVRGEVVRTLMIIVIEG
jgi:hypothetical protein